VSTVMNVQIYKKLAGSWLAEQYCLSKTIIVHGVT
jgi:hypothetical protein